MNSKTSFRIDGTFFLKNRGLVLETLRDRDAEPLKIKVGDTLELTLNEEVIATTQVLGIELSNKPLAFLTALKSDEAQRLHGAMATVILPADTKPNERNDD